MAISPNFGHGDRPTWAYTHVYIINARHIYKRMAHIYMIGHIRFLSSRGIPMLSHPPIFLIEWRKIHHCKPCSALKVVISSSTSRSITNAGSGRALVPISATSNFVPIGRSSTILLEQHSRRWQTRIGICSYFSENTGILAIAMQA